MARRRWRREGGAITQVVVPILRQTAHYATDRATTYAKGLTQQTIRSVGLGRLANAVGSDSSLRSGSKKNRERRSAGGSLRGTGGSLNAWGAVFARGGSESRANQALLAYSQGATIVPGAGKKWLAFATDAVPKRAGRNKMTPARYRATGLERSIGKLTFVAGKNSKVAYLVARKVTVSRRTGQARAYAGRTPRGSDRKREVVAFVLIRFTRRAQRYDQGKIMREAAAMVPRYAAEYQPRAGV